MSQPSQNMKIEQIAATSAATKIMFSLIFIFLFLQIIFKKMLTNAKYYGIILSRSEESRIILSLLEAIDYY